jgi:hypothetical protein
MVSSFHWLEVPTVAVWCLCAFAQTPREKQTIVNPLPNEEILQPCQYQMVLPQTTSPLRAAWVIYDRGQDYLQWFLDRRVRAFASEHHLALVLAMHCRSKEREDIYKQTRSTCDLEALAGPLVLHQHLAA